MADEMVCLKCTLFACDETSPDCLYQIQLPTRTVAVAVTPVVAGIPAPVPYNVAKRREQYRAAKQRAKERRASLFSVEQPVGRDARRQATVMALEEGRAA